MMTSRSDIYTPMLKTIVVTAILLAATRVPASAQDSARATAPHADSIAQLVARLDLEHYKATVKGLTQFGDRRQGTARNRAAVDWIEQQLRSYGCTNTARITYDYHPEPPPPRVPRDSTAAQGGGRLRGIRNRVGV